MQMIKIFIFLSFISANFFCQGLSEILLYSSPDPNSNYVVLSEGESIDGYTKQGNQIFGGEIDCNINPLKGVDIQSFQVLPGTKYSRDKNRVYYPIKVTCKDYEDCGVCYYDSVEVKNANPAKFEYLGKGYAKDSNYVFYRGRIISAADNSTFRLISCPDEMIFATDANNVYNGDVVFEGADPSTFRYEEVEVQVEGTNHILVDKNKKWAFYNNSDIIQIGKENNKIN